MNTNSQELQTGIEAFAQNDYHKAFAILLPLAEQGIAEAQLVIGNTYWFGLGTQQDDQLAFEWISKAAEQGHANACNTLGCIYQVGALGLATNDEEAKTWYRRAVENGFDMYPPEWVENLYK